MPSYEKNLRMMAKKDQARDVSEMDASNNKEEEIRLIDGLKKKEAWAFHKLIDLWAPNLFRVAVRFLKQQEDAEEVVQEVMKKVVENVDSFRGDSALGTWLHRIAVNESLMRLRSQKGKQTLLYEETASEFEQGVRVKPVADWSKVPDSLFEQKELHHFFNECVSELPEDFKAAYILKDREELSEDEVCDVLEITKPAMRNRVHRARLILRKKLENKYVR